MKKYKHQWGSQYGNLFFKRAKGYLREMESSKATAKIILPFIVEDSRILDAGCGVGHYLRSILKISKKKFSYHGIDITQKYINLANKINWGIETNFKKMNIENTKLKKKHFDISFCSNVLLHINNPGLAIQNLIKSTKKVVILRTLVSEKDYITKEVINQKNLMNYKKSVDPKNFLYYNSFSKKTIEKWVKSSKQKYSIKFIEDKNYLPKNIKQNSEFKQNKTVNTKIFNNKQFNGPIMLDWHFVIIQLK
jgi:2-polyprenyl-3-methyl-5-hydroxy-6-metoxy-1,4-benzoquinol methylase